MIWGFGALAYVVAYVLIGWRLAIRDLPNAWQRARDFWSSPDSIDGSVRTQTVLMVLFWPFLAPARWIHGVVRGVLDDVIPRGDPVELARQVKDRERRIADLERELGIGRAP